MPFLFVYVCDLLEELERPHLQDVVLLPRKLNLDTQRTVMRWFQRHSRDLGNWGTNSDAAKSLLRPDRLTDRDYGLNAETLALVIARVLMLSQDNFVKLQRWQRQPHLCDLAVCVGEIIDALEGIAAPSKGNRVTVDEIDQCLLRIASFSRSSSPEVQSLSRHWTFSDPIDLLARVYCRLQSREAKWLTRFILKDYGPVRIPDRVNPDPSSAGLPNCLNVSIELFTNSAPVPTYREGTMVVKGFVSKGSARLQKNSRGTSPANPVVRGASELDNPRSAQIISPMCSPNPYARKTSTPVANADSQESSQSSGPITFARGILKPSKNINTDTFSSVDGPVSLALGSPKPCSHVPTMSSTAKSFEKSENPTAASMNSANTGGSPSPRTALGAISPNTSLRSPSSPCPPQSLRHPRCRPSNPFLKAGLGHCQLTTSACPLTHCIFLLSPCISKSQHLIDNLLPWHGALYLTSLPALASPHLPQACPATRKIYRKIVLVETHNRKETVELLNEVKNLNLQKRVKRGKRDGKGRKWDKEYVEVYDWRLLECIAKMDLGKELTYDAWKRCFVCVV